MWSFENKNTKVQKIYCLWVGLPPTPVCPKFAKVRVHCLWLNSGGSSMGGVEEGVIIYRDLQPLGQRPGPVRAW